MIFLEDVLKTINEYEVASKFPLNMRIQPFSPQVNDPDFSDENILRAAQITGTREPALTHLRSAAKFLRDNEMFRLAAIYMYRAIYTVPDGTDNGAFILFSQLEPNLAGTIRGMLRFLSAIPIVKWHREQNIPEMYSRDAVKYLGLYGENFAEAYSNLIDFTWMRQELDPDLCYIQILRFGFMIKKRDFQAIVFKHKNGNYLAFAIPGIYANPHGVVITKDEYEKKGGFITDFHAQDGYFIGNRINERGLIISKTERIPADGYRIYISSGKMVIDMHIPSGGGMSPDISLRSWQAARDFYRKRLGENCPDIIVCNSWICSPVMEEILPENANLVKFVQRVHRLPALPCENVIHPYIHKGTSLYDAMNKYIVTDKNRFCNGMMFLPLDEF